MVDDACVDEGAQEGDAGNFNQPDLLGLDWGFEAMLISRFQVQTGDRAGGAYNSPSGSANQSI